MNSSEGFKLIARIELYTENILILTDHFPRKHKYTLGTKLQNLSLDLCENIYQATYCRESRKETLHKLRASLHLMDFMLRLCHKVRLLSDGNFLKLSAELLELGRMTSSWIKKVGVTHPPKNQTVRRSPLNFESH